MDDLNLMTIIGNETILFLKQVYVALAWAWEFRAKKSSGMVIGDGNITNETAFYVQFEKKLGRDHTSDDSFCS